MTAQSSPKNPKSVTAEEAVSGIRSGQRILVGSGCAAPQELLRALVQRAPELRDVELVHLLTFGIAPYVDEKYHRSFRHNAFFIGKNVRDAVNEGRADFSPIFLSEIPNLFYHGQMRLDLAMISVTPPDQFGYCSLGIHPDIVFSGVKTAKMVIAQVNKEMPRTHGDTFIHVSEIDWLVEHDAPILELPPHPVDKESLAIARHVASLVRDESTLQLGIGNIPNAVLTLLDHRRDLGIHTEMFSDGIIDLIEKGVITCARKGLHPGKAVSSFAMGTRRLYDYINDNPFFEFHPTEYVNSPRVIAKNRRMVSINSAIQIDITGQVSADSMGTHLYSGIGGQVDFVRGAAMGEQGRPIIALPSTAKKGTVSRIVPTLEDGTGVVTSRGDVHYVVTEYGIAYLHGKSIRERAMALIEIAHPDFRADLRAAALKRKLVSMDWQLPTESDRYPADLRFIDDFKGTELKVRPLRSSDADRLMAFFYSHKPDTVFGRYRFPKRSLSRGEALRLSTLDYRRRFALGAFVMAGGEEHMVAVGRYTASERTHFAQTALVVHEDYRRLGIATFLYRTLKMHAVRSGIRGFTGDFAIVNRAPINLHRVLGAEVFYDKDAGVYRYIERFDHEARPENSEDH